MVQYYILAVIIVVLIVLVLINYKKCPKGKAIIVYNKFAKNKLTKRIEENSSTFIIPFIQGYAILPSEPIILEIEANGNIARDKAKIEISIIFTIMASSNNEILQNAVYNIAGLNNAQIIELARDIMTEELYNNLSKLTIRDISDEKLLINAIGPSIAKRLKDIGFELKNVILNKIKNK